MGASKFGPAWVQRWGDWISAKPETPGVWRRRDGGFRVRGRTVDPKTGKLRGVNRALPDCRRAREASTLLEAELESIRAAAAPPMSSARPRFEDWAVTVFERKIASGAILSARGRDKWESVLRVHLLPVFGGHFVDKLTREDIERLKTDLLNPRTKTKDAKRDRKLTGNRYKPETVNTILGVLRQVMAEAAAEFNFHDPCSKLENVSKRGHRTYTYEEPNALKPEDVPRFLDEVRVRYPDHYAFVFLGFTTGQRPSSLRPLRRSGPNADVKWDDRKILIRRSHTKGSEVMDATKTGTDLVLDVDQRLLEVLQWHCERLDSQNEQRTKRGHTPQAEAMARSELLFPAAPTRWNSGGGFRSVSVLDKAFDHVGELLGLGYKVSPRAMRRTFQDLARAAEIADVTTRAISGHATPAMQRRYSTVAGDEQRAAMGKVIDLATKRREREAGTTIEAAA